MLAHLARSCKNLWGGRHHPKAARDRLHHLDKSARLRHDTRRGWHTPGHGCPVLGQAVEDTFANSKDYNEWTVTNADTIGIFLNLYEPIEIAKDIPFTDMPGYDPSMGDMGSTIGSVRITIKEVMAAFPNLPLFGFAGTEIVEIGVNAASLYG